MVKLQQLLEIYDIYLHLNKFIDIQSFRNLSVTCKSNYNIYCINKRYIDKTNISNIFKIFDLCANTCLIKPLNKLTNEEIKDLNLQLNSIYNKFYKNKYTSIADFLVYLLQQKSFKNSNLLFETFISQCSYKNSITRHSVNISEQFENYLKFDYYSSESRFYLTSTDISYIIKYCDLKQLDIVLNWIKFPMGLLSYLVKDLLHNESIQPLVDKKIMKIIDYMLYNYCSFGFVEYDKMYFDSIINELIIYKKENDKQKKTALFMYILQKKQKYGFPLDYQAYINSCLESINLSILKLLISELKEDNKILEQKIQIIILPILIKKICENGNFDFLKYIIFKMLGRIINLHKYLSALCDGISTYYINNKNEFKFNKIQWIYSFLTEENKYLLDSHISFTK